MTHLSILNALSMVAADLSESLLTWSAAYHKAAFLCMG